MPKIKSFKLTTLLTGLVAASVISTIVVILLTAYHSEKESLLQTTLQLNYSKAQKISRTIESLFDAMQSSMENISEQLDQSDGASSDLYIQERLDFARSTSRYFNSISWIEETGVIRAISPSTLGLKGQRISTKETEQALKAKGPVLSAPFVGPTGRLLVFLSQPLYYSDGRSRGIIGGTIYLEEANVLSEVLGYNQVEQNGSYYYVVGPSGRLLFHPEKERIGENVSANPIVQKLLMGQSGMELVTNIKGVHMVAAYSVVAETGWGVVQQTPLSSINHVLIDHLGELLLYSMAPLIALLLLAVVIARKLAKPFTDLAGMVTQLSKGEHVTVPPIRSHWNREADLLGKSVVIAIESVQLNTKQLKQDANTDALTGLANRRSLDEFIYNFTKKGDTYSLILIDIDYFKDVNDKYGHSVGDEVLKHLALVIKANIGRYDRCFRYGGEEFVILCPNTVSAAAYETAEKVRGAVQGAISPIGKPITVSLGIAEFPLHSSNAEELFRLADHALYQSKQAGRNRTTLQAKEEE